MESTINTGGISYLDMRTQKLPCTAVLTSVAAGREIAITVDGTNYFVPQYDTSPASHLSCAITTPVTGLRFTGTAGDNWRVL